MEVWRTSFSGHEVTVLAWAAPTLRVACQEMLFFEGSVLPGFLPKPASTGHHYQQLSKAVKSVKRTNQLPPRRLQLTPEFWQHGVKTVNAAVKIEARLGLLI
jgi:hypothetical protein